MRQMRQGKNWVIKPLGRSQLPAAPQQEGTAQPWSRGFDAQLPMGQLDAQEDAPLSPCEQVPVQPCRHSEGPQDAPPGQMHDPACPSADAIPANSRRRDITAIFFILISLSSSL
jgi:hypothetical protein